MLDRRSVPPPWAVCAPASVLKKIDANADREIGRSKDGIDPQVEAVRVDRGVLQESREGPGGGVGRVHCPDQLRGGRHCERVGNSLQFAVDRIHAPHIDGERHASEGSRWKANDNEDSRLPTVALAARATLPVALLPPVDHCCAGFSCTGTLRGRLFLHVARDRGADPVALHVHAVQRNCRFLSFFSGFEGLYLSIKSFGYSASAQDRSPASDGQNEA